ncbi:magnesium/cobalt transporter CorA [Cyanobium sp. HWJ4-Hawea]|nr:magnesium/cobalt transporter CorA [Cyanobium sp. WAJ14-Wanaka]MCP9809447.1 magnesium/cobalt transporter CorA [Cyanobium sp. HWJ4-Hawea]
MPSHLAVSGGLAPTKISVLVLDVQGAKQKALDNLEQLDQLLQADAPLWIRVNGHGQPELIEELFKRCNIPKVFLPLALETPQSPRLDSFADVVALVVHRLNLTDKALNLVSDQVSILLTHRLLISIEEVATQDGFNSLTSWLLHEHPNAADEELDDLLHYMVDTLLDGIFPMLEQLASRLDSLEEAALRAPSPQILGRAYHLRGNLRRIRQQLWPLRNQTLLFLKQNQPLMGQKSLNGFREIAENVAQIFESCELLRHQCDAVTNTHMASTGNRMNQIMKTLTIISAIFAPITFLAGVYGMNFDNIPELHWRYGYFLCLALMATVATIQTTLLWKRGWFEDWSNTRRQ